MQRLIEAVDRLRETIERQALQQSAPRERTGYVDLPHGRVQMTIREH